MRKLGRRTRVLAVGAIVIFGIIGAFWRGKTEPSYDGEPVTYWIVHLLGNPGSEHALLEIGPDAIPYLIDALHRQDGTPQTFYAWFRAKLPARLALELPAPRAKAELRNRGAYGLGLLGPQAAAAAPDLAAALHDADINVVQRAATALNAIGPGARAAVPQLIDGLKSPDAQYRSACLEGLTGAGRDSPEAVPVYIQLLNDTNLQVRVIAARALGQATANRGAALDALEKALEDPNGPVRPDVARALAEFGPSASNAVPTLLRMLQIQPVMFGNTLIQDDSVTALEALEKIGPVAKEVVPELNSMTLCDVPQLVVLSARALWAIEPGNDQAVSCLRRYANSRDENLAHLAIRGLMNVGPQAEDALPRLAEVPKDRLRLHLNALVAAWKIKPAGPAPMDALVDVYRGDTPKYRVLRAEAIELLGELGPAAQPALPVVIEAAKDRDSAVRAAAVAALGKIQRK